MMIKRAQMTGRRHLKTRLRATTHFSLGVVEVVEVVGVAGAMIASDTAQFSPPFLFLFVAY